MPISQFFFCIGFWYPTNMVVYQQFWVKVRFTFGAMAMPLLCKWDDATKTYVFPGADPSPPEVNLPGMTNNLVARGEIVETLSRLGVSAHVHPEESDVDDWKVECDNDAEPTIEIEVEVADGDGEMEEEDVTHQPFTVTPLMIAVAEREAEGWRAIADALKALMLHQQQSNRQ